MKTLSNAVPTSTESTDLLRRLRSSYGYRRYSTAARSDVHNLIKELRKTSLVS